VSKLFGAEKTERILRMHVAGEKPAAIARAIGSRRDKVKSAVKQARELGDGFEVLEAVARENLQLLQSCADELTPRLASISTGELIDVMGELLQQLRRAGVRLDLPVGSQDSTDSTSQLETTDSR